MNKQISLSALSDELAQVKTHKKEFLNQIDHIVPWDKCFCPCKRSTAVLENAIPRFAKANSKIEYDVCAGKFDSGWQKISGGLIWVTLQTKFRDNCRPFRVKIESLLYIRCYTVLP